MIKLEFERRQGVSNLELICAEFVAMDESRMNRKQLKKERKKQRKQNQKEESKGVEGKGDGMECGQEFNMKCKSCCATNLSRSSSASSIEVVDEIILASNLDNDEEDEEEEDEEFEKSGGVLSECCLSDKNSLVNNSNTCIECETEKFKLESISTETCGCEPSDSNPSKSFHLTDLNDISLFSSFSSSSSSSSSNTIASSVSDTLLSDHHSLPNLNNRTQLKLFDLQTPLNEFQSNNFDFDFITDEEKMEYYANKSILLIERRNRRELLKQKFQNLKMSANFKIRPRNIS